MCLYPKLIRNRKYTKTKKNGGNIPPVTDERVKFVPIGCGKCMECRKQKAREWQVRLFEEIKENKKGKFITLTFSNESIQKIIKQCKLEKLSGYELDNQIATKAIRLFLERWRKKYKKSLRHWLVTELGHNGTENIHIHGVIFTEESYETIENIWNYGFIWPPKNTRKQTYVNEKTINYITKYITKTDLKHKQYKSIILTSPGIGSGYTKSTQSSENHFKNTDTNETYRTKTGHKISLPIYYRNKIYSEDEREKLWLQRLDKNERWVCGEKINALNTEEYYGALQHYRKINQQLGYGTDEKNWNEELYERQRRILLYEKRLNNIRKKQ